MSTLNNTQREPSPVTGLAWHGSSSKQKTEMLASQTADGDLRVWSVSKPPSTEPARVIRLLGTPGVSSNTRNWFGWSKNGRLIQHVDGDTRAWDVRTKKVSAVQIPTVSEVAAITNYGPTATLFTICTNHMIQQYDVNPQNEPLMVANVQHAPVNAPPTPPDSIPRETPPPLEPPTVPVHVETGSSEDEEVTMSPLQKIAQEMDQMEEERRDRVTPLSPISSRASMSSASSYGRRGKSRSRDRYGSSRTSERESEGTLFSSGSSTRSGRESISIRTTSSMNPSRLQPSSLRQEMLRSPEEAKDNRRMDLFPYTKARLSEVKFRAPQYGNARMTPDVLRKEMISVVFGWDHDIEDLIRDEQSRHASGSASAVLLGKWLGDNAADAVAEMIGSESMSSSDWMLLALSQMGQGSQKQIGEAFVRRLLERDELHPAVAILLGLGQQNDAVEAYVSRKYYIEAVLLTCLLFPNDWQRQSYLVRKWGEIAVSQQQAELAVRCFSCTTIESSEPWFSPRAQDEVFAAQQNQMSPTSPLTSPPSAGNPNRLTVKNAALKLNTKLDGSSQKPQPTTTLGVTPIIDSAISPVASAATWKRSTSRGFRDPSSARTATPGGYGRKRDPSAAMSTRSVDPDSTPLVGSKQSSRPGSRTSHKEPGTAIRSRRGESESLPSPAPGVYNDSRGASRTRGASRDRNYHGLQLDVAPVEEREDAISPYPTTSSTRGHRHRKSQGSLASGSVVSHPREDLSPLPTGDSTRSFKGRNIDRYIDSLEEANAEANKLRAENRSRSRPRTKDRSPSRGREEVKYIRPAKRSPSSPVPMSTDDAQHYRKESYEESRSAEITSPVDSRSGRPRATSRSATSHTRGSSRQARRQESPEHGNIRSRSRTAAYTTSKPHSRGASPEREEQQKQHCNDRGRHQHKRISSGARSPSSPSPMDAYNEETFEPQPRRYRQRSTSRKPAESGRRPMSPERSTRARSSSRRNHEPLSATRQRYSDELSESKPSPTHPADASVQLQNRQGRPRALSRKELAAKELEERRLSLARRPSAPQIPHPETLSGGRPGLSPIGDGPTLSSASYLARDLDKQRSRTVEPEQMRGHSSKPSGGSGMPAIGLPATPRAMRHPRYMGAEPDEKDKVPAVPELPAAFAKGSDMAPPPPPPPPPAPTYNDMGDGIGGGGLLLQPSVYARSASAPPEQTLHPSQRLRAGSTSKSHSRNASHVQPQHSPTKPSDENNIIIVEEPEEPPPVLPELQHLATPPPPPPPPTWPSVNTGNGVGSYFPPGATAGNTQAHGHGNSGVINIAMDSRGTTPAELPTDSQLVPPPSKSPGVHRRGRGSISGLSSLSASRDDNKEASNGLASKWKTVRDRMRSESKSRAKSPPQGQGDTPSPYETQLPNLAGQISPPISQGDTVMGAPIQPQPEMVQRGSPPRLGGGYRNPKEIARGIEGGMI